MIKKNIEQYRGAYKEQVFVVEGDYTSDKIYFTAKASKSLTAVRYIDLANTAGGGDDSEITATLNEGYTTITVKVQETHTQNLTADLYYDLDYNDDDQKTLRYGVMSLVLDVRSPYDSQTVPSEEYYNQLYDRAAIYKFNSDGTGSELQDKGFNTTFTSELLSSGMYKLTSSESIFDLSTKNLVFRFTPLNLASTGSSITDLTLFNTNVGFSNTELLIGVTNYNAMGELLNCDFIIEILRVRE